MKPVIVFQQVPHESLGTLATVLADAGLSVRTIELFRQIPDDLQLDSAAGLIVLGGPMNVDQSDRYPYLKSELGWIRQALENDLPTLGICLGSQLLAKALGASVYPNEVKEIGWYEIELTSEAAGDHLFAGCEPCQTVFQWHGDTFDLPAGAIHLARSERCHAQAFRHGSNAYGLQFHIEVTAEMIDQWLDEPNNRRELAGLGYIDPVAIRNGTPHELPLMHALGHQVLPRFAALCRENT